MQEGAKFHDDPNNGIDDLISVSLSRAKTYRLYATITATICGIILILSIVLFVFSGQIERSDIVTSENIEHLQNLNAFERRINALRGKPNLSEEEKNVLKALDDQYMKHIDAFAPAESEDSFGFVWKQAQITIVRFGTFFVMAYVVSVFFGFYRSNTRIAIFYEMRAQTLRLVALGEIPEKILLALDSEVPPVDFAKSPSGAVGKLSKLWQEAKGRTADK